jgi:hypothetical protein
VWTGVVTTFCVKGRPRNRLCDEACHRVGPPPSLRSATAVLTATRGKDVDRVPPHLADCPRNVLQNEGRGLRHLAKSQLPRLLRGRTGLPIPSGCSLRDIESELNPNVVRSVVNGRCCVSCDSGLLESRSPRRDASAGRKWRRPGRAEAGSRRSTPRLSMGR